jgi:hypothetical protein
MASLFQILLYAFHSGFPFMTLRKRCIVLQHVKYHTKQSVPLRSYIIKYKYLVTLLRHICLNPAVHSGKILYEAILPLFL